MSQKAKPRSVRLEMVNCRHTVTLLKNNEDGYVDWGYENQIHYFHCGISCLSSDHFELLKEHRHICWKNFCMHCAIFNTSSVILSFFLQSIFVHITISHFASL